MPPDDWSQMDLTPRSTYFVSVHSESAYGAGLYIVPSDSKAPLLLERLAKEGQRKELERLDNAKCLCLDELKEERDLHKR